MIDRREFVKSGVACAAMAATARRVTGNPDASVPSYLEGYEDLKGEASGRFLHLRLKDESLRFLAAEKAEPLPVADAGLERVQSRLLEALSDPSREADAREALLRFRRLVREEGL